MQIKFKLTVIPYCVFIVISCASPSVELEGVNEIELLTEAITQLSKNIKPEEAKQSSKLLISTTYDLGKEYNMVSPAKYHNLLVNIGLKDRGLCCHWTEDLHFKLRKINPTSIKFDWVVARHGDILREHNSVVIFSADSTWEEGLIFDPWRKAGDPYWGILAQDNYPWELHPLHGQWNLLHCK